MKKTYVEQLIILFAKSQQELLKTITDIEADINVIQYRKNLLKQIDKELALLQSRANPIMEKLIIDAYIQGIKETNRKLNIKMNLTSDEEILKSLSKLHRNTINVFIRNLQGDLNNTNYFIGRQIKDKIQEISMEAVGQKLSTNHTVQKTKNDLIKHFSENGISAIKTKNGRSIRMESYADLVARSTTREVTNTATIKQIQDTGRDLVKISRHNNACPLCQKYQGRVYSITGNDKRFPKLDVVFSNGYANIHPRCRHSLEPYVEEFNDVEQDMVKSNEPFKEPNKSEKQVQTYYQKQAENQKLRNDILQWQKYKTALQGDAPKTLTGFKKMKNDKSDEYKELKRLYKEKFEEKK